MITRFSIVKCAECGHEGRPEHKSPVERNIVGNLVPGIGHIQDGASLALGTLHCRQCGARFTDKLITKASAALAEAKGKATQTLAEAKEAILSAKPQIAPSLDCNCGSPPLPGAKFCGECGKPLRKR